MSMQDSTTTRDGAVEGEHEKHAAEATSEAISSVEDVADATSPDADDADEVDDVDLDDPLVIEGDVAGDYLERLLDILDLDGDIDLDVEGSRAVVAVDGGDLEHLVGPNGQTLDALQELTRLAVTARTGNRSRLMLDIDGFRADQRSRLTEKAERAIADVQQSGESKTLSPMNPFQRKVVHDAVANADGVTSESTGEEPNRRVVILPQ